MSAAEQLCLFEDTEQASASEEIDLVEAVIAAHGGDARRAIRELMADADFLRDQLYTASQLMSQGFVRGWRPRYERLS
jgi:hypothetical protein